MRGSEQLHYYNALPPLYIQAVFVSEEVIGSPNQFKICTVVHSQHTYVTVYLASSPSLGMKLHVHAIAAICILDSTKDPFI